MRPSPSHAFVRIGMAAILLLTPALPALARGANGGGAAAGAAAGASGSTGPTHGDNNGAETSVSNLSRGTQMSIDSCDLEKMPTQCIADALDKYADELAEIAPQFPPSMRDLPEAVRTAARKVRAAKTKTEAVSAIKEAIVLVHKSIELLKADDSVSHQVATREGAFVAATLEVAGAKMEKAVGL
jgi:hypothetical protein